MSYSRSALAGIIAGLLSGLVFGLLYILFFRYITQEMLVAIAEVISSTYGVPYDVVYEQLSKTVSSADLAAPLVYPFQYALLGALFGLLQHYIELKLRKGLLTSILLTGAIFTLLLGYLPVVLINYSGNPILTKVIEKIGDLIYVYSVLPGVIFTVFLLIIHYVHGPWKRLMGAKPSIY